MIYNPRLQEILKILLSSQLIVTGEYLCNKLGVSDRTIRSDIKELNYIIERNGATVSSEKSRGYRIDIFDEKKFNHFLENKEDRNIFSSSTSIGRAEYVIVVLLINNIKGVDGITQIDLADELHVSLSSLKNDIKLAKSLLAGIGLNIDKIRNKGIGITGNEENMRYCISKYVLNNNKDIKVTLESLLKQIVKGGNLNIEYMLKKNIYKFNYRLSDVEYRNIQIYIIIMLVRNAQHKNILYDEGTKEKLQKELGAEMARNICNDIKDEFKIDLPQDEIFYLTKYIIASSSIAMKDDSEQHSREEHTLVRKILELINNTFDVDLTDDEILENFLSRHLSASLNRARYGIKVENSMMNVIKNNYPFALELSLLANSIISKETNFSLTEDDIGFIALHFAAAIERKKKSSEVAAKRVVIVCASGVGTSLLLKVKLESYFKNRLDILDVIPRYEFNSDILDKSDLIIATVPLDVISNKIIYIKSLLDNEEIKLIEEKINYGQHSTNDLVSKLKKELFLKDVMITDRDSLLDFATEELIKKGYINRSVKQRILNREKIASTEIGGLVAIPHDMSEDVKESFIAVIILKKAITWSREQVQLILLIGMTVNDKYEWKSCLEHLYKSIIHIETVNKIIKCSGFQELKKVIGTL